MANATQDIMVDRRGRNDRSASLANGYRGQFSQVIVSFVFKVLLYVRHGSSFVHAKMEEKAADPNAATGRVD